VVSLKAPIPLGAFIHFRMIQIIPKIKRRRKSSAIALSIHLHHSFNYPMIWDGDIGSLVLHNPTT